MKATVIMRSVIGALRGGGVRPAPELDEQVDLDHLVIEVDPDDEPFPYQVDGDYLGEVTRLEFRHVPGGGAARVPLAAGRRSRVT